MFTEQNDVDLAFADYDALLADSRCEAASYHGRHVLCAQCGSAAYLYNSIGGHEPGARTCLSCGAVANGVVIYETMFGRILPTRTSNYKRIHHWHERISQLLLLESPIPRDHMLAIGERLLDGTHSCISKDSIRAVLRSLGMQVYIEKWLQIIFRCTGISPPAPGRTLLMQLDKLFLELQQPFSAHKISQRRNFLNYNYVFCRLFQKMNCTKYCMFFPLIRSKHKLRVLDEMWTAMVQSLGWEVSPLEQVAPFSVQVSQPHELLQRLVQSTSNPDPPVRQTIPLRMVSRKWDHRSSENDQPLTTKRRSSQLAQSSQKLALRLKRPRRT